MTEAPDWALAVPAVGVHNPPPRVPGPDLLQVTWQQMQQVISGLVNEFLRQVAVALGAIEIFGFKPYQALVEIGEDIAAAKTNFDLLLSAFGLPTMDAVADLLANQANDFATFLAATGQATFAALGAALQSLIDFLTAIPANLLSGALPTNVTLSGTQLGTLLQYLNSSGQYAAAQLTGSINGALTLGGTTLSTLFTNINGSGQLLASGLTGGLNTAVTFGGTALSTFFQNINASGQLLAPGITGALNGALTLGGVTLSTLVTNINSSGQLLGAGITGAINTAATVAGQTVGTIQANAQGLIEGINNAAAGLLSGGSTLVADAATNLGLLFGSAPQYLQGVTGAFGQTATNAAYAAAAAAASAQAAEQTRINSAFNAVFNVSPTTAGNVNQTIDFSAVANQSGMSGIMLPGSGTGNGFLGVTSGQAVWQGGTVSNSVSNADIEVFPTQTTSDYQVVTVTLGSLNDTPTSTTGVHAFIVARCNSARNTFVAMSLTGNSTSLQVQLRYRVSGSDNPFSGGSIVAAVPTAATGGVLKWIIGDPSSSSPYAMQVLYNGAPIITFTDSSHVSQLGASQLYVGLGAGVSTAQAGKLPLGIRSVTYQDNPPAPASYPFSGTPTAGTKGRMYVSNDVGLIQRDNGTSWERIWGGPLGWMTAPPTSGWSTTNMGTSTWAADLDGYLMTLPPNQTANSWNIAVRTLTPSSNYTATFYLDMAFNINNDWSAAICLRNSSSGSFVLFEIALVTATVNGLMMRVTNWTNATTLSATSSTQNISLYGPSTPNWLRVRDDGSNRYFEFSYNGVDWILFFSSTRTSFITPNQIGVAAYNHTPTGTGNSFLRLRSLSGVS